ACLRFACSQLMVEHLDPLVNPGVSLSPYLHQQNAFNATMDIKNDHQSLSTCTTCTFTEDFSSYWTTVMYFRARNRTYKRVPQMANICLDGQDGGMTVYYLEPYGGRSEVTAFRPDFRMLTGTPSLRTSQKGRQPCTIGFRRLKRVGSSKAVRQGRGGDTKGFPPEPCHARVGYRRISTSQRG
ncbi:hypothetical protein K469DRAFT_585448, partial [Zopfia rhizophila CBS 207.26]